MSTATQLSKNFALSEFSSASHRALTAAEIEAASWWARNILQPARDRFGPIRITSFVRSVKPYGDRSQPETGAHSNGNGVDVVPPAGVSMREFADFFAAAYLPSGALVAVIDEDNHVHLTHAPLGGARPGYSHGVPGTHGQQLVAREIPGKGGAAGTAGGAGWGALVLVVGVGLVGFALLM